MNNKKKILLTILFFTIKSYTQINKGYWMMGGGAGFSTTKNTTNNSTTYSTGFNISPNIGYFVFDKLAIGTSGNFTYTFDSDNSKTYNSNSIAPFIKYYFLESERNINIFSEIRYEIMRLKENDFKADKINLKAGVVFFLNSSVGIEIALNYSKQKTNQDFENIVIYLSAGFQIHLEKK